MRTIKFKAWDKDKKIMIYDVSPFQRDGLIIMQFTGLTDKNGKDIYEFDLIKEDDGRIYKVVWYDNGWSLAIEPYHNRHFRDAKFMQIVGNFYENE